MENYGGKTIIHTLFTLRGVSRTFFVSVRDTFVYYYFHPQTDARIGMGTLFMDHLLSSWTQRDRWWLLNAWAWKCHHLRNLEKGRDWNNKTPKRIAYSLQNGPWKNYKKLGDGVKLPTERPKRVDETLYPVEIVERNEEKAKVHRIWWRACVSLWQVTLVFLITPAFQALAA